MYVHGYSAVEQDRLIKQAQQLSGSVFEKVDFSAAKKILEVGCGVGAQTEILLNRFPHLNITSIDVSESQLDRARQRLQIYVKQGRVKFQKASAFEIPYADGSFDGVFICWVLEHITNHVSALQECYRVIRPGGRLICDEVANSTFFLAPESPVSMKYWAALNDVQKQSGDPYVGLKLGNLLSLAGFETVKVEPRTYHLDRRARPQLQTMLRYWLELLLSAQEVLINLGRVSADEIAQMKAEFAAIECSDAPVFYFQAFQGFATKA